MKKSSISPALILLSISLLIVGFMAYLHYKNSDLLNDNKSKLTLLNTAKKVPLLKNLIAKNLAKQNAMAEAQVTDQNVLTVERVYTEEEINEMTESKFVELLKDTERRLPKLTDLKKIPPGALHHTPPLIILAGRDLGVIKEVLKVHESYERVAAPFYKSCAKNDEGTTPVRALCLTNLIEIKRKKNENLNLKDYPERLIALSKMITDI
ncbi:MAG: hypothetical protein H7281_00295 [Bacteriovorax sp.]|nr:hypothetical protein [Bacteriovorax sp.]